MDLKNFRVLINISQARSKYNVVKFLPIVSALPPCSIRVLFEYPAQIIQLLLVFFFLRKNCSFFSRHQQPDRQHQCGDLWYLLQICKEPWSKILIIWELSSDSFSCSVLSTNCHSRKYVICLKLKLRYREYIHVSKSYKSLKLLLKIYL